MIPLGFLDLVRTEMPFFLLGTGKMHVESCQILLGGILLIPGFVMDE